MFVDQDLDQRLDLSAVQLFFHFILSFHFNMIQSYPSTLKMMMEFRFDPTADGYLESKSQPFTSLILSFHSKVIQRSWIFLEADQRSTMIAEPQLASDLTRHPNSNLKLCIVGESTTIVDLRSYKIRWS
jgi:hypothetical protein